jgi:hypothetical protein
MKVCVTNGKYTNCHRPHYFPNSLRRRVVDWFGRYETVHPTMTWAKVQCAFIIRFSKIRSDRQAITTSLYSKQKKYEMMEDYYDQFL